MILNSSAMLAINGGEPLRGEVSVECEVIDVTSWSGSTKPDLSWTHVDKAGHFHAYDHDGQLPTLTVVRKRRKPAVYRCIACNKKVPPPATHTDHGRQTIPGRETWTLTVHGPVPPERFSFWFTAGDKEYFGFAESYDGSVSSSAGGAVDEQWECTAYPVAWRWRGGGGK